MHVWQFPEQSVLQHTPSTPQTPAAQSLVCSQNEPGAPPSLPLLDDEVEELLVDELDEVDDELEALLDELAELLDDDVTETTDADDEIDEPPPKPPKPPPAELNVEPLAEAPPVWRSAGEGPGQPASETPPTTKESARQTDARWAPGKFSGCMGGLFSEPRSSTQSLQTRA